MAHKFYLPFSFYFLSDGATGTVTVNLATAPLSFAPLASMFVPDQAFAATATDVIGLSGSWAGSTVTLSMLDAGVMTVAISPVPAAGEVHSIGGNLIF